MSVKLKSININGLFGYLNHVINLMQEGPITIIHGPNGCGKTTILKLLYAAFNGQFENIIEINFNDINFVFSDNRTLTIERILEKSNEDLNSISKSQNIKLYFHYKGPKGGSYKEYEFSLPRDYRIPRSEIDIIVPYLERIDANRWVDRRFGNIFDFRQASKAANQFMRLNVDGFYRPRRYSRSSANEPFQAKPKWLTNISKLANVFFIEDQRLISTTPEHERLLSEKGVRPTVEMFSKSIQQILSKAVDEALDKAQELDSTFLLRLINQRSKSTINKNKIFNRHKELQEERAYLVKLGLVGSSEIVDLQNTDEIEETLFNALWLHLADSKEKLKPFDDLRNKLSMLLELINPRIKPKELIISKEHGFLFKTKDGSRLALENLSSGEQHEIVLFYQLLFNCNKNSLIMIDEPELSLHVDWQRKFLNDLEGIARISGLRFIIATHSPQIIGERRSLAVGLHGGILDIT